ncbi:hypothetical protein phiRKBJ001_98 [Streptomyces phage phiRKBJ001]|nr:hypothetical protein phiRKBJ001_98 [Streptomyces phage phiRKBJ001]
MNTNEPKATCSSCKSSVPYSKTKIVEVPIKRTGPVYPGVATVAEYRVCVAC